jgi:uncharacterized protein YodC (DUF2158 family)
VTWKKADEVRLKSGGSNMTVMGVLDAGVRCCWFDKCQLHKEVFPAEALIEAAAAAAAGFTLVVNLGKTSLETWERLLTMLSSLPEGTPQREEMIATIKRELEATRSAAAAAPLTLPQP